MLDLETAMFFLLLLLFDAPATPLEVTFFLSADCPISNFYSPEIQRICGDYRAKAVSCRLVYPDPALTDEALRKHVGEYGLSSIPAVLDPEQKLARAAGATITPEAVIANHMGKVLYRGRIDNFYAAIGKPRRVATEHDVRRALDEALAGKPVSVAETHAVGCFLPPAKEGRK
jgi:hypothetical protein